ncbi:MAG: DUF11 domain-containing protein [Acidobacteriota bacterium]|nr:MAG: DUF11 domain-containing protein [Acidobacteriota bacterium]
MVARVHLFPEKTSRFVILAFILMMGGLTAPGRTSNPVPVTVVSAASFEATALAPGSIASAFGTQLATGVVIADTIPLPTMLGNTTVSVKDSLGVTRQAEIFFVSPGQINFLISEQTASGQAMVTVQSGDGTISMGVFEVKSVAPSLFSANADGQGVPAAVILRVKGDGTQIFEPVGVFDSGTSRFVTTPIDLGPVTDQVFLILYGSGIRKTADPNGDQNFNESVAALIGGEQSATLYAGVAPGFIGLDQINLALSRTLIGRGKVNVALTAAGGSASNLVEIEIAGSGGASPPQISGFSQPNALAGQTITVNGMGFSAVPADNLVRIAGSEAQVISSTAGELMIQVPFGVSTGSVSVSTLQGEGISSNILNIRTSVSGLVETTARDPIPGIKVKVAGTAIEATSGADGNFLLPDVPGGVQSIEIDTSTLPANLPFPSITRKLVVQLNRDNPLTTPVQIQPATGPSVNVGGGGGFAANGSTGALKRAPGLVSASIQTGGITFEAPDDVSALFPDGATSGLLTLTKVENSRTPIALPPGVFSSSIVQITPFGVQLDPGGKLIFPNTDNLPAGSQAFLYTLDLEPRSLTFGSFVVLGQVMVSADGQTIETAVDAVKRTSFFFVTIPRQTTTVVGRVVDGDGTTPVRWALARSRGQEGFTDGNGGFVLRDVPAVNAGDLLTVEASLLRPDGRVDRALRNGVVPNVGGTTVVSPDLQLSPRTGNRPPSIISVVSLALYEGGMLDSQFLAVDPDPNQTLMVTAGGASFASIVPQENNVYLLSLKPGAGTAGNYTVKLMASDGQGGAAEKDVSLTVLANRAPVLSVPQIPELPAGQLLDITLSATDPDAGQMLTFSATGLPQGAVLTKTGPTTARLTWTPGGTQVGDFPVTFNVADDAPIPLSDSRNAVIKVTPVSDLTISKTDGVTNYIPGGSLTYTIVVTNNGPSGVMNALVSDTKAPQIANWSWECTQLTGGASGCTGATEISVDFTDEINLPAGASVTYTVLTSIRPNAIGNLVNAASIAPPAGTVDPNSNNNTATDIDTVSLQADLSITKTDNTAVYTRGSSTTYTIEVRNAGPSNVFGAVVSDVKPDQIDNWTWTCVQSTGGAAGCDGVQSSSTSFTDTVDLPSGSSIIYSVQALISTRAAGTLNNTATIAPPENVADPFPANNSATDSNTLSLLWEPAPGPEGGIIQALLSDGEVILAGTFSAGIFRSGNNGGVWENVFPNCQIESLVRNSSAIFAGTFDCGILRSIDQGKSWVRLQSAAPGSVTAMTTTEKDVFAGYLNGDVYRSIDNGETWEKFVSPSKTPVLSLFFHNNILFAGTNGEGILITEDEGQSWDPLNNGLQSGQIYDFVAAGSSLLAGTDSGVYLLSERSFVWTPVNKGLESPLVLSLAVSGQIVLAGTGAGVFFSQDGGQNWSPLIANDRIDNFVLSLASHSGLIFAGTYGYGVYRFLDGWTPVNNGLHAQLINAMAARNEEIFAATEGGQIFRTNDDGKSWNDITSNLRIFSIFSLHVENGELLAGGDFGVFRYVDAQGAWTEANNGINQLRVLTIASRNGVLYAGTDGAGIYRSVDGAKFWQSVNDGLTNLTVFDLIAAGENIFAATAGGVFISKSGGVNWTLSSKGIGTPEVFSIFATDKYLFAGTEAGIHRSMDNGDNWEQVSSIDARCFAFLGSSLFAGTPRDGVFISRDEGGSWEKAVNGLLNLRISDFAANKSYLFTGTGGSVFKTPNLF